MKDRKVSQCDHILAHMMHAPITPIEALDLYGCFRLAARIRDLKDEGYPIINVGDKKHAIYQLETA